MIKGIESILIGSENAKELAEFYKNVVGLEQSAEMEIGEEGKKGYEFSMKGTSLYITDHSQVNGKNQNPERIMFNLEVDDIEKEAKRLDEKGIKKHQDIYHVEGYGLIATFVDPDGNFFQLVLVRAGN